MRFFDVASFRSSFAAQEKISPQDIVDDFCFSGHANLFHEILAKAIARRRSERTPCIKASAILEN